MPVRVYLLKQIANETLETTPSRQDSGLEPEDANKQPCTLLLSIDLNMLGDQKGKFTHQIIIYRFS